MRSPRRPDMRMSGANSWRLCAGTTNRDMHTELFMTWYQAATIPSTARFNLSNPYKSRTVSQVAGPWGCRATDWLVRQALSGKPLATPASFPCLGLSLQDENFFASCLSWFNCNPSKREDLRRCIGTSRAKGLVGVAISSSTRASALAPNRDKSWGQNASRLAAVAQAEQNSWDRCIPSPRYA
ncbi:hypothetical protein V8C44DRAFT_353545 [Trichoderma aethiopicum]